jgi:leucyl aminopeptidase
VSLEVSLTRQAPEGAVEVSAVSTDGLEDHPLRAELVAVEFEADLGSVCRLPGRVGPATVVVGLGPDSDRTVDSFRTLGGAIARACAKDREVAVGPSVMSAAGDPLPAAVARALAEGLLLGNYRYTDQKSEPERPRLSVVHVVAKGGKRIQAALDVGRSVAQAVCVARDLVNEPGGSLTPPAYADRTRALGETYGFEVDVLDEEAIAAAGMGGLRGVNRGSEIPARFVEMVWRPEGRSRGRVALVGKGITFDSGGLSLKPTEGMLAMKGDMAGSAAVVGAFCALGSVTPGVEVRGYLPLTDNMTGGDATRLGDVLRISNGKTVEVHNTDAEGRLVLADALSRASAAAPDAVVDLATLTGACMVALGQTHAGVMGNDQGWIDQVLAAGETSGERSWPLPMPDDWRKSLDSDVADMKNVGGRFGGASLAALFLREFVGEGIPWAHLDIAGPAFVDAETSTETKGGTGYGVRTLLSLLKNYRKP